MTLMISVSGVRGIVGPELNPLVVASWTAAFSELIGPGPVVLGRDSRRTGEALALAAASVFRATGHEVWDVGIVPTPTVQLAVEHWGAAGGIILSASHNPAHWNALKFVDRGGSFASPERFAELRRLHEQAAFTFPSHERYGPSAGRGDDALRLHREAIGRAVDREAIRAAGLRVLVDAGHGAGGVLLPALAEDLGVALICLRAQPTGFFSPNPEPSEEALAEILHGAPPELSFAAMVDPDADRLALALPAARGASSAEPAAIGEEWTLPLVAESVLARRPGPVVTNLSTSSRLEFTAARAGAEVRRTPVGEAHVVAEMRRCGAVLGGEGNGGVIDPEVHLGRDSAVAFARLCEAEARLPGGLRARAAEFPPRWLRKEKLPVPSGGLPTVEPALEAVLGPVSDRRDGLRWTRPDGFVHVRASGTEPVMRVVLEAGSADGCRATLEQLRSALGGR